MSTNFFQMARGKYAGGFFRGAAESLETGWSMSMKGNAIFALPMAAFAAGIAPRGHAVSEGAGALSIGLGAFVGGALGGFAGALAVGALVDGPIGRKVTKGMQFMHDFDRTNRGLHMGGQYQDTEAAYTMRQVGAREMSGSLLNARTYLGREGAFLHG